MNKPKPSTRIAGMIAKGRKQRMPKGQVLQSTIDRQAIYYLEEGFVKRYLIGNEGNKGIQIIYGPGDLFPITLVHRILLNQELYDGPEVYYYEAMSDVKLCVIGEELLKESVAKDPMLYSELMMVTGVRLSSTLLGLENVTLSNSYKRVAHRLAVLADRFGEKTANGIKMNPPLTHQDIADVLSITRETVTTAIKTLRQKGLIKTNKGIIIPSLKKLRQEAYN